MEKRYFIRIAEQLVEVNKEIYTLHHQILQEPFLPFLNFLLLLHLQIHVLHYFLAFLLRHHSCRQLFLPLHLRLFLF